MDISILTEKINLISDNDIRQILKKFIIFLQNEKRMSKNTILSYLLDIQDFFLSLQNNSKIKGGTKQISKKKLKECNASDFRKWIHGRALKEISHRSNARSISGVKRFFKFLNSEDILKNEEIDKIKKPKFAKKLPRTISIDMFDQLCQGIREVNKEHWQYLRDKAIAMIMFTAGLRISEVLAIKTADILNQKNAIYVIGKGNKSRIVPIIEMARDEILEYISSCPIKLEEQSLLFVSNKGKEYSQRLVQRCFKHARNIKNLPDFITPHTMRHSCATILLQNSQKADGIKKIQELLGHSQLSTTQIYTQINNSNIVSALKKISYWDK